MFLFCFALGSNQLQDRHTLNQREYRSSLQGGHPDRHDPQVTIARLSAGNRLESCRTRGLCPPCFSPSAPPPTFPQPRGMWVEPHSSPQPAFPNSPARGAGAAGTARELVSGFGGRSGLSRASGIHQQPPRTGSQPHRVTVMGTAPSLRLQPVAPDQCKAQTRSPTSACQDCKWQGW